MHTRGGRLLSPRVPAYLAIEPVSTSESLFASWISTKISFPWRSTRLLLFCVLAIFRSPISIPKALSQCCCRSLNEENSLKSKENRLDWKEHYHRHIT